MKLKLIFAYDGSYFLGSAKQPHSKSVQDTLQKALAHLGIFSDVLFASRTDKGVHSSAAVASVECGDHFKDLFYLKKQINKFSHPYIHIKNIEKVPEDFEVRFCVKAREYRYIFCHDIYNPFLSSYVYFYQPFDICQANDLLACFLGKHDFKFFQKSKSNSKSTLREIFLAHAYTYKKFTIFKFKANGFLRGQIRLSIASVLAVLEGKLSKEELEEQIEAKKCYFKKLVPASGLYLSKIIY